MQVPTAPSDSPVSPSASESPEGALSSSAKAPDKQACSACGKLFSRRGLAGHMRLKHGLQAAPKAPLPAPDFGLAQALGEMAQTLVRIEQRLASLEELNSVQVHGQAPQLAEELREVLAKIEKHRSAAAGEDAIACAARFRRLGLLRRRQAELLYELGPAGAVSPDELLGA